MVTYRMFERAVASAQRTGMSVSITLRSDGHAALNSLMLLYQAHEIRLNAGDVQFLQQPINTRQALCRTIDLKFTDRFCAARFAELGILPHLKKSDVS